MDFMSVDELIRRVSADIAASGREPALREAARRTGGVPAYADLGGILVVMPGGTVVRIDSESGEVVAVADDDKWHRFARDRASKRFPVLQALAPARPPDALVCDLCGGAGTKLGQHCGRCMGLGWIR
jgi:hypothetical protein